MNPHFCQVLYAAIVGLLVGCGWAFCAAWSDRAAHDPGQRRTDVRDAVVESMRRADLHRPEVQGPPYDQLPYWEVFKTANLIGRVARVPDEPDRGGGPPLAAPRRTLETICSIVCLAFEGGNSRAVVRYAPGSGVEPPAGWRAPGDGAARVSPPGGWVHLLDLEDRLWNPFSHIRLTRVDADAEFAEFVRSEQDEESGPEKLFRDELGLPQAIAQVLQEAQLDDRRRPARPVARDPFVWIEGEKTRRILGEYHIGRADWDAWRDNSRGIFHREIGTRTYRRHGVSGVQITKASERFRQFGVIDGDVILAVNGQPVKSKAEAIRVGKQLYKRGVRRFETTVLSRGRQVTRTLVAPG